MAGLLSIPLLSPPRPGAHKGHDAKDDKAKQDEREQPPTTAAGWLWGGVGGGTLRRQRPRGPRHAEVRLQLGQIAGIGEIHRGIQLLRLVQGLAGLGHLSLGMQDLSIEILGFGAVGICLNNLLDPATGAGQVTFLDQGLDMLALGAANAAATQQSITVRRVAKRICLFQRFHIITSNRQTRRLRNKAGS